MPTLATESWQKFRNSQIQDGGRTPYWKSFISYNWAPYCPIKMKFGARSHNRMHTKVRWWKCQFRKSNMADGHHFESHYISITQPQIVQIWRNLVWDTNFIPGDGNVSKIQKFANSKWRMDAALKISTWLQLSYHYCPIKIKFGVRRQNHTHMKQVKWSKCLIIKIQNSGRQHFENGYISVSEPRIIQIWQK